ncbi:MAG: GNA1162 family protein [Candidatus Neomarinimicrobiota bacterium]
MKSKYLYAGRIILFISIALLLAGCAGPFSRFLRDMPQAEFLAEDYQEHIPTSIAVLPFDNQTTDIDAPEMIRDLMNREIQKSGYTILDPGAVTLTLREEGISYGGQLNAISVEELQELLDADALVYGEIVDFKHFITGLYNERSVATQSRLVDIYTGEVLWEDQATIRKRQIAENITDIGSYLLSHLTRRVFEKARHRPLMDESKELVAGQLSTLPWGPARPGYPSWRWENPNLKVGAGFIYGYPNLFGMQLGAWRQRIGVQVNLSFFTQSVNLLYAPVTRGPKKRYVGLRIGQDRQWSDIESPPEPAVSVIAGIEALRWRYARLFPNAALSITVGYTLTGNTGFYVTIHRGFYFN